MTAVVLAAAAIWSVHHALAAADLITDGYGTRYTAIYAVMFGVLVWQLGLAYLERPRRVTARQQSILDRSTVVGVVPAYNEDPHTLRECLRSMIHQERRPDWIAVIDDGSRADIASGYADVYDWFRAESHACGVTPLWLLQPNGGKREAQATAVLAVPGVDYVWTVDSDTVSDPKALDELLKPMADPEVMSVAGIVLAANVRQSFLTRFTDLWFVAGQLNDRSALSTVGAVWVNSGPIAVYRASIVRDNLDSYLSEEFFGRPVPFSDDSMLTLYAMLSGRTVQQPSAYAYSLMPEKMSHHWRQFERWMRGSFIRSWWRVRYLPLSSAAWWLHLLRWFTTVTTLIVAVDVLVIRPIVDPSLSAFVWAVTVPIVVGYAQTLRYMVIRRSDQSAAYQWATWSMTPVAVFWSMTVLRACRWWSIATVLRIRWGTRQEIEVSLRPGS